MPVPEPFWWYGGEGAWQARALAPLARLYGRIAERSYRRGTAYRSRLPVVCVGNLTAGGTGKTPTAIAIAERLTATGHQPVFLTRGYGGRLSGPVWIDEAVHFSADAGDEPLLLARRVPTVVSRNRGEGARFIEASGRPASAIIMDDGLLNTTLAKDLVIAVVDGSRGIGNGLVIPAGPLRAPLGFQMGLADCMVVNGGPAGAFGDQLRRHFPGPVISARLEPSPDAHWIKGSRIHAFAGIGNPARFFESLRALGAELKGQTAFPDHHVFTNADAERLVTSARAQQAQLVTTAKDMVRLDHAEGQLAELRSMTRVLPVEMVFEAADEARLSALLDALKPGGDGWNR